MKRKNANASRYQYRQNQTRRRATTSSSRSDETVEDQVEQTPEGADGHDRDHDRPADRHLLDLVEPDEEGWAREQRDRGRGAAKRPPLVGQLAGLLG
jgi:hypothetical protein